jgi:hypothetical protein
LRECRWPLHLLVVPYRNRDIPQDKLLFFVEKSVIHWLQHFGVKETLKTNVYFKCQNQLSLFNIL